MKKYIILMILLSTNLLIAHMSDNDYKKYKNTEYNYMIIVPTSWETSAVNSKSRHVLNSIYKNSIEIKVRAFKSSEDDMEEIANKTKWDLRKIDPLLNKIIETENVTIKKNVKGKLLLFEYKSKKRNLLQRTMITLNDNIVYIIECRAPIRKFYRYEKIFNIAFSSFNYINYEEGSGEDEEKDESAKKDIKKKKTDDDDSMDSEPSEPTKEKNKSSEENFFEVN
jgi:hypothetical protein